MQIHLRERDQERVRAGCRWRWMFLQNAGFSWQVAFYCGRNVVVNLSLLFSFLTPVFFEIVSPPHSPPGMRFFFCLRWELRLERGEPSGGAGGRKPRSIGPTPPVPDPDTGDRLRNAAAASWAIYLIFFGASMPAAFPLAIMLLSFWDLSRVGKKTNRPLKNKCHRQRVIFAVDKTRKSGILRGCWKTAHVFTLKKRKQNYGRSSGWWWNQNR